MHCFFHQLLGVYFIQYYTIYKDQYSVTFWLMPLRVSLRKKSIVRLIIYQGPLEGKWARPVEVGPGDKRSTQNILRQAPLPSLSHYKQPNNFVSYFNTSRNTLSASWRWTDSADLPQTLTDNVIFEWQISEYIKISWWFFLLFSLV